MAWPRILGRKRGSSGCNVSGLRDTCEIWNLSWATVGHRLAKQDQNLLFDARSNNLVNPRNRYDSNGAGLLFGIAREPPTVDGLQSLRRAFRCHAGRSLLHYSPIESEPSVAATRASEATAPLIENVETLHGARSAVTGVSAIDLLQIEDGRTLYAGLTSMELLAALGNLQLVSFEPMVDLILKVLTSRLMRWPITTVPILWLIKRTAYSHFCAGEDVAEAGVTLSRMWKVGLKGVLDYSLDDAEDEESCDQNVTGFLNTIRLTRSRPDGSVSFGCVKISALCPIGLLERVSDHLRWQHKNPDYKLSWRHDSLPVCAPESPTYHTQRTPGALTAEEERDY